MIRKHEFNSRWLGKSAGIVSDSAFFAETVDAQQEMLAPYAWVEYRAKASSAAPPEHILHAGFMQVDTQIYFRLGLSSVEGTPSLAELECISAADEPFNIEPQAMAVFEHERFAHLRGMTADLIAERYGAWSNDLIARHPATCVRVMYRGALQGWFLSSVEKGALRLALAMSHHDAKVSGMHVFQKAILGYRDAGHRVGYASFSVTNQAVHNIYAKLGARFTEPEYCYLWQMPGDDPA
jgi:hypothetical protein